MSLTTQGKAPGPVRFYLACDRLDCTERISFDLVIADPPPDAEADLIASLLHEASKAAPLIKELGWTFIQGGEDVNGALAARILRAADAAELRDQR